MICHVKFWIGFNFAYGIEKSSPYKRVCEHGPRGLDYLGDRML